MGETFWIEVYIWNVAVVVTSFTIYSIQDILITVYSSHKSKGIRCFESKCVRVQYYYSSGSAAGTGIFIP